MSISTRLTLTAIAAGALLGACGNGPADGQELTYHADIAPFALDSSETP